MKPYVKAHSSLSFSQRNGFTSIPSPLKPGELTPQLRNELNAALREALEAFAACSHQNEECYKIFEVANWNKILRKYWVNKFKQRFEDFVNAFMCVEYYCLPIINRGEFYEVFEVIEDLLNLAGEQQPSFPVAITELLERNQAPYVLRKNLDGKWWIIQTGTDEEKEAVLNALTSATSKYTVGHLEKCGHALTKGDPVLATEEAIKGFEAELRNIGNLPNKTGVDALKKCASVLPIPLHINKMLESMLNYRGDTPGIGHAMKDSNYPPPDRFEAQFIYVVCCAAISFLSNKNVDKKD